MVSEKRLVLALEEFESSRGSLQVKLIVDWACFLARGQGRATWPSQMDVLDQVPPPSTSAVLMKASASWNIVVDWRSFKVRSASIRKEMNLNSLPAPAKKLVIQHLGTCDWRSLREVRA